MTTNTVSSPVLLSYVAALRGIKMRKPGEAFVYVNAKCLDHNFFTCLAASNPEGQFYALMSDDISRAQAENTAKSRQVSNVTFLRGPSSELLKQIKAGSAPIPPAQYISIDDTTQPLSAVDRNNLLELADSLMAPSGLLSYRYKPYADDDGALRFLVREAAPEMDGRQAEVFLKEIKTLGSAFLASHPDTAAKLDDIIAKNMPDEFFSAYDEGNATSGTFDTIVAMRKLGFSFVGDSIVASNYMELSVPLSAQQLVMSCQGNHLYEPIKDFVLNRNVRNDVWCKQPSKNSVNPAELYGGFSYGITVAPEEMPKEFEAQGKTIDLSGTIYKKLIELMALTPVTIGDFLGHPTGETFTPAEVVSALQILIACGFVQPMRGMSQSEDVTDVARPRLVGTFNQHLGTAVVTTPEVHLASTIVGAPVTVSARDALVMQALDRVGLANSVSALLPELERIASNPELAARIMESIHPTEDSAHKMIEDTVSQSIVRWYGYGLFKAA